MLPDTRLPDAKLEREPATSETSKNPTIDFLARAAYIFRGKSFNPHPLFAGGHAQTLASFFWPRRFLLQSETDEERLFDVAPNVKILAHCRWQPDRSTHPTMIIWHGIEGSSSSVYMLATALKAFSAGFNVLRVNLRNCGGTEHLTSTLYHGGLTEDLRALVTELVERDRLSRLFLVGFSLGGNMVLKLAGEYGGQPPKEILAMCAVSPSVDLGASGDLISQRSNWIYHRDFVRRLKKRIRLKRRLYPKLYDTSKLHLIRTIRQFDERFTSVAHGFSNAADYYYKASAIRVIDKIRIPTLIIHAQDDPFIPFAPLRDPSFARNPNILLLSPERGGHVAFIAAKPSRSHRTADRRVRNSQNPTTAASGRSSLITHHSSLIEDRFWAENRVVEFCQVANQALSP